MAEKMIKDLKRGDRVELTDGDVGTIDRVYLYPIVEVAGDVAYHVNYTDDDGEKCGMIVGSKQRVSVLA